MRLLLVTGAEALVTGAVGARHWCGSRRFPVKENSCVISIFRRDVSEVRALFRCVKPQKREDIRIQEVYMQTRLTARGILKDFLDKGDGGSSSVYHQEFFTIHTADQDGTGSILILHNKISTELVPS